MTTNNPEEKKWWEEEWNKIAKGECPHKLYLLRYTGSENECSYCKAPRGFRMCERDMLLVKSFISKVEETTRQNCQEEKKGENWRKGYQAGIKAVLDSLPEEKGPTLCGECNLNGPLCTRCYGNRQYNALLEEIKQKWTL